MRCTEVVTFGTNVSVTSGTSGNGLLVHSLLAMTSQNNGLEFIKVDARGHKRVSPQRRSELLEEFERSGMSTPGFARLASIKYLPTGALCLKRARCSGLSPWINPMCQRGAGCSRSGGGVDNLII